ncbi:MAG: serine hydrolase [Gemmatimonadetes bacterium]|nr:serine hydrolase [Gemmatimonadota bacterium]NNM06636.1 serine hydrolase [Gemmatimonadota bacterium]
MMERQVMVRGRYPGLFRPMVLLSLLLMGSLQEARVPATPTAVLWAQAPDVAGLDAMVARAQGEWPVPGLAMVIVKDGQTVLMKGYGERLMGSGEQVDEHTLFAIASNSKAFTSAALAMLVEEGRLSWDDRVQEHLPYFQLYSPYVSHEMRIRDLLSHRSGLGTYSGDLLWYGTGYTAEEVVRRARYVPQAGAFRASYGYSNLMFIAAGEVVRAVSGKPWPEFVESRILAPLGMDRTVTSTTDLAHRDNVATPHKNWIGRTEPIEWYNWDAMAAAGGIISSVSDMARWLKLQLGHGESEGLRLFSEGSSWEMWTVHTARPVSAGSRASMPSTHFRGYGLGWSLNDYLGRLIVSHGGGYDGMFSRVVLVPEEDLAVAVFTNSMTSISTAITNSVLDAYLGGEERDWSEDLLLSWRSARLAFEARQDRFQDERMEGTRPSLPMAGYTGRYGGPMYGDATVTEENGGLVLRLLPNPDLVADLTHLHHDTFLIEWRKTSAWFGKGVATFALDPLGKVAEMKLDVPNDDLWFLELEMVKR